MNIIDFPIHDSTYRETEARLVLAQFCGIKCTVNDWGKISHWEDPENGNEGSGPFAPDHNRKHLHKVFKKLRGVGLWGDIP